MYTDEDDGEEIYLMNITRTNQAKSEYNLDYYLNPKEPQHPIRYPGVSKIYEADPRRDAVLNKNTASEETKE